MWLALSFCCSNLVWLSPDNGPHFCVSKTDLNEGTVPCGWSVLCLLSVVSPIPRLVTETCGPLLVGSWLLVDWKDWGVARGDGLVVFCIILLECRDTGVFGDAGIYPAVRAQADWDIVCWVALELILLVDWKGWGVCGEDLLFFCIMLLECRDTWVFGEVGDAGIYLAVQAETDWDPICWVALGLILLVDWKGWGVSGEDLLFFCIMLLECRDTWVFGEVGDAGIYPAVQAETDWDPICWVTLELIVSTWFKSSVEGLVKVCWVGYLVLSGFCNWLLLVPWDGRWELCGTGLWLGIASFCSLCWMFGDWDTVNLGWSWAPEEIRGFWIDGMGTLPGGGHLLTGYADVLFISCGIAGDFGRACGKGLVADCLAGIDKTVNFGGAAVFWKDGLVNPVTFCWQEDRLGCCDCKALGLISVCEEFVSWTPGLMDDLVSRWMLTEAEKHKVINPCHAE